jgi:hypothetical protein
MISFSALCKEEPYLLTLENQCKNHVPLKGRDSNDFWYHDIKPTLIHLVGNLAHNPKLRGCEKYDVAYAHLYDCLR